VEGYNISGQRMRSKGANERHAGMTTRSALRKRAQSMSSSNDASHKSTGLTPKEKLRPMPEIKSPGRAAWYGGKLKLARLEMANKSRTSTERGGRLRSCPFLCKNPKKAA